MATITENLQIIKDSTMAIKQAILDKGGEVGDLTTYADAISNLSSGGGDVNPTAEKNDVTFYDYDGTIRYSYTTKEFLALSEMPPLPTQKGLICQEWNWSYEDAMEYVAEYGMLNIGATYITDDGKTRLYIKIGTEGRMTVPLYFYQTKANGITIDWGDGSATQTLSGTGKLNTSHTYANIGDYCITFTVASGGTLELGHGSSSYCVMGSTGNNGKVYCNMLQKVEIGWNVNLISNYAIQLCYSLSSIVIPNSVLLIGNYSIQQCYSLNSVVIPKSVKSIGSYAITQSKVMDSTVIPNSVISIGPSAFQSNYSLSSAIIPKSVTSIESGLFQSCNALNSVVIPKSVKSIGSYAFSNCYILNSVVIPDSITSVGFNLFQSCYILSSAIIPNSSTLIESGAFKNCYSMSSAIIPKSVTSIGDNAFNSCYSMAFYDFSTHISVPKLANINAFTSIPSDCKIIVPDTLYDEWIAATNWSAYATYTIKKSDWDNLKQGGSL